MGLSHSEASLDLRAGPLALPGLPSLELLESIADLGHHMAMLPMGELPIWFSCGHHCPCFYMATQPPALYTNPIPSPPSLLTVLYTITITLSSAILEVLGGLSWPLVLGQDPFALDSDLSSCFVGLPCWVCS